MQGNAPVGYTITEATSTDAIADKETNIVSEFSFIDRDRNPLKLKYKMTKVPEPVPPPQMGGRIKHKHTYKYRKCTVCGCKSRKYRKECAKKTRNNKKVKNHTRKH
jgi:hypothetical protein